MIFISLLAVFLAGCALRDQSKTAREIASFNAELRQTQEDLRKIMGAKPLREEEL